MIGSGSMVQNSKGHKAAAHNTTREDVVQACLNTCTFFGSPHEEQLYAAIRHAALQLSLEQTKQLESQLLLFQRQGALAVWLCQVQLELASANPTRNGSKEVTDTHAGAEAGDGSAPAHHDVKEQGGKANGVLAHSDGNDMSAPAVHLQPGIDQAGGQPGSEQDASIDQLDLTAELDMSTDEILQAAYSVADTLSTEEARALAAISASTYDSVNKRFADWRKSLRTSFQRMESKAARNGYSGRAHATGHLQIKEAEEGGAGMAMEDQGTSMLMRLAAQEQRLRNLQDDEGRLKTSPALPGNMAAFMQDKDLLYEVKESILKTLSATPASTLQPVMAGQLIQTLHAWLIAADADKQISFVRIILHTLQALPVPRPLLQQNPLLRAVVMLTRSKHSNTAAAALATISHWQSIYEGLVLPAAVYKPTSAPVNGGFSPGSKKGPGSSVKMPTEPPKPSVEERAAALAVPLGRQSSAASQPQPRVIKPSHYSMQPLSADDIRKQRQKQAAREAYARFSQQQSGAPGTGAAAAAVQQSGAVISSTDTSSKRAAPVSAAGAGVTRLDTMGPPVKRQAVSGTGSGPNARPVGAANGFKIAAGLPAAGHAHAAVHASNNRHTAGQAVSQEETPCAEAQQAMLKQQALRKRRQEVTAAAMACCNNDVALVKEMVDHTLEREQQHEQVRAALASVQQRQQQTGRVSDMRATVSWYEPGWIPASFWDTRSKCPFHSLEASRGSFRPNTTHPSSMLPVEPPVRERWPPPNAAEPVVPFLPEMRDEEVQQNEQMWTAGVRSPFFVRPPFRACPGVLRPPPAQPTFVPLSQLPPPPVYPYTSATTHLANTRASQHAAPSHYSYTQPAAHQPPPPPPRRPAGGTAAQPVEYYAVQQQQPVAAVQYAQVQAPTTAAAAAHTVFVLPAAQPVTAGLPAGMVLGQSLFGNQAPQVLVQAPVAQPQAMPFNLSALQLQSLLIPGMQQAATPPIPQPLPAAVAGGVDPALQAALQQLLQAHQMLQRQS